MHSEYYDTLIKTINVQAYAEYYDNHMHAGETIARSRLVTQIPGV